MPFLHNPPGRSPPVQEQRPRHSGRILPPQGGHCQYCRSPTQSTPHIMRPNSCAPMGVGTYDGVYRKGASQENWEMRLCTALHRPSAELFSLRVLLLESGHHQKDTNQPTLKVGMRKWRGGAQHVEEAQSAHNDYNKFNGQMQHSFTHPFQRSTAPG